VAASLDFHCSPPCSRARPVWRGRTSRPLFLHIAGSDGAPGSQTCHSRP
jgi:hypothetical protein